MGAKLMNGKKPLIEEEEVDTAFGIDDDMPDDDEELDDDDTELDLEDDEKDDPGSEDDDSEAEDDDEIAMPDVVVTQPSTASSEPVTLATADTLMDLLEPSSDSNFSTILEEGNLNGKHAFWQGRQVCCLVKQLDGLYTVYLWKGSVPGKSYSDVDGASAIEWHPTKARLDFPISWHSNGRSVFVAKIAAFAGQVEYGTDFTIYTDVEFSTRMQLTTDHDLSFDAAELETYSRAAVWTAKVASWFEKTHAETEGEPEPD